MSERIQKVLANHGIASRREVERLISQGLIKVNGRVAELGCKVTPEDRIVVNGRVVRLNKPQATEVLMYHKQAGEICTRQDPEDRPTVFKQLPKLHKQRWIAVGRLDFNTSGLLLFTNNGELANKLMHPSSEIEREYAVRVYGEVTQQHIDRLAKGVKLEDGMARFDDILDSGGEGRNHWYHVILKEGRNREVRRLWESQGLTVSRLIRVRFGNLHLPRNLRQGTCRKLNPQEYQQLLSLVE